MNNEALKKMEKQLRIVDEDMEVELVESNLSKEDVDGNAINSSQQTSSSTTTNKPDETAMDCNTAVPPLEKKTEDITSVTEDEDSDEEDDDDDDMCSSDSDSEAIPQEYRPVRLQKSFVNITVSCEYFYEEDLEHNSPIKK